MRKAFVKIINKRLQDIFLKHKALLGLNFASLPHQLTTEPLHLINNILEFHRQKIQSQEHKNDDLLILFQDMSKAFDRVNIYMLQKAMARLKIPPSAIALISGLFLNWKNTVFTTFGNTDLYDVLVGIDQGEVISPLLWVIYYDPLLARIQQTDLGYKMETA